MALGDLTPTLAADPGAGSLDAIKRRQQLADALMQKGMDTSPIQSPWQGAARALQGILGGYQSGQAEKGAAAWTAGGNKLFGDAVAKWGAGQNESPAPSPNVTVGPDKTAAASLPTFAGGGGNGVAMPSYANAIANIESRGSGDYGARGPQTASGDRAYGKYQVMGANIPSWTQAALGRSMTRRSSLPARRRRTQSSITNSGSMSPNTGQTALLARGLQAKAG